MSCKNIGRDAVESYILKLIARPINIRCKSSNFIIIMRRVQSLKQPMVRATCFSFYINFTRANLCRVSIEQNYTACVSTPLQCERAHDRSMHQQSYKKPDMYMRVYMYTCFHLQATPTSSACAAVGVYKGSRNNTRWYMKSMITKGVNTNSCFV